MAALTTATIQLGNVCLQPEIFITIYVFGSLSHDSFRMLVPMTAKLSPPPLGTRSLDQFQWLGAKSSRVSPGNKRDVTSAI